MELYPENILESLDFNFIKREIRKLCSSEEARAKTNALSPSADMESVKTHLTATDEILSLMLSGESFPTTHFVPVSAYAQMLKIRGNVPETRAFSEIRSTLGSYLHLFVFIKKRNDRLRVLFDKIADVQPEESITKAIDLRIDERGEVRSNASKELSHIRSSLIKTRASADRIFARAIKKYRERGVLADFDETISENRRVLAIQASYKGQVQGIFHGSSSKNSIVYIEPGETVEVNNEIAQLQDDEMQEIRRILKELADELRPHAGHIIAVEQNLVLLDFIKAKALYAKRENCCLPIISSGKTIKLIDAYNPVLKILNREKQKTTIPLSLDLNPDLRILVISGPNAGGKSISLKTLGLLSLMLQSGILIPVDPLSEVCFFSRIYADIGDNQSIENELSTYSSKLQKMQHFLNFAHEDTLLMIDEFGSGSDPDLGSSLAQVFLERLNSYKVFGIFTTHYNDIKALAAKLPGVQNAAMLFDQKNFNPEYRLEVGNPGSSYTFEVAEKSGIPAHLIGEAKAKISRETLEIDKLLVQLQDEKLHLEKKRNQLNSELIKLRKLEAERKDTIVKLEEKLDRQSRINEENDRLIYWGQRFQKLVQSWMDQKNKKDKKDVISRFVGILNQRSGEVEQEEKKSISKSQSKREKQLNELRQKEVKTGDSVKIIESGMTGVISEIKKDKFIITLGQNIQTTVGREQFIPASARLESEVKKKKRKKSFSKNSNSNANPQK